MAQGQLPFQYEEEGRKSGVKALAGLPVYLDLAQVMELRESIGRHLHVRDGEGGLERRSGGDVFDIVEPSGWAVCR